MKKANESAAEYIRRMSSAGGKARAKQYSASRLSQWGKLGGRPRKHERHRVTLAFVPTETTIDFRNGAAARSFLRLIRRKLQEVIATSRVERT